MSLVDLVAWPSVSVRIAHSASWSAAWLVPASSASACCVTGLAAGHPDQVPGVGLGRYGRSTPV